MIPGMASSQNEQDNRRYAVAAGVPMLEPSDSQEAYDFMLAAIEISERWKIPVLLRVTTRVCHSYTVVRRARPNGAPRAPHFERDIRGRGDDSGLRPPGARRLRQKLAEMQEWNETSPLNHVVPGGKKLGIITSGISFMHVREAAPEATRAQAGLHASAADEEDRGVRQERRTLRGRLRKAIPYLVRRHPRRGDRGGRQAGDVSLRRTGRAAGAAHSRAATLSPEPAKPPGKPPQLCDGCQYRLVFQALRKQDCIVAGDIGCYTLGVLPPFEAMDSCVCMGASLGVGLGLRHVLPPEQARRVVSVIGDSTFVHSGISGLVEMVYNPPPDGHVLIILDNRTTAMTGHQEHPGTGRTLDHEPTGKVVIEDLARSLGIEARARDRTRRRLGRNSSVCWMSAWPAKNCA